MKHIGLFEGIGGFSLAARWMGWETIAWCEINPFGQKVLTHHFPNAKPHHDITKTDFNIYRGRCDILTGGFPCQPYSAAGKRLGTEDDRHLWPEMLRAIREIQPGYVVGENVRGLTNWNGGLVFDQVQADLEAEGYEVLPFLLPACAVNAPHRRDRIWFIAYSSSNRWERERQGIKVKKGLQQESGTTRELEGRLEGSCRDGITSNTGAGKQGNQVGGRNEQEAFNGVAGFSSPEFTTNAENIGRKLSGDTRERGAGFEDGNSNGIPTNTDSRRQPCKEHRQTESGWIAKESIPNNWRNFPTVSPLCSRNDKLSNRLSGITFSKWRNESIKALGNAVVPALVLQIFKAIQQYENEQRNNIK